MTTGEKDLLLSICDLLTAAAKDRWNPNSNSANRDNFNRMESSIDNNVLLIKKLISNSNDTSGEKDFIGLFNTLLWLEDLGHLDGSAEEIFREVLGV
jgi:hypothetical protein